MVCLIYSYICVRAMELKLELRNSEDNWRQERKSMLEREQSRSTAMSRLEDELSTAARCGCSADRHACILWSPSVLIVFLLFFRKLLEAQNLNHSLKLSLTAAETGCEQINVLRESLTALRDANVVLESRMLQEDKKFVFVSERSENLDGRLRTSEEALTIATVSLEKEKSQIEALEKRNDE